MYDVQCPIETANECCDEGHTFVTMGPELMHDRVQLSLAISLIENMKKTGKLILKMRKEIDSRMEHASRWISSY